MTDYFRPGESPFCVYTDTYTCYRRITEAEALARFDGVSYLHTCERGKVLDRACNECSEACYIVDVKNGKIGKPPDDPPRGDYGIGWPWGY